MTLRIGSLFSGAGGLDLAVEQVFGAETVWHCEYDPAASKVLEYHYPNVPNLGDITRIDWTQVEPVDIICGGFPCTDVSAAGKRAGMHGTRSGLWSYMRDAIDALRPSYIVIENVRGLLNANANRPLESATDTVGDRDAQPVLRAIGAVLGDLADIGVYECRWVTVPASAVGAPHRRERVFILATVADACGDGCARHPQFDSEPHTRIDREHRRHTHRRDVEARAGEPARLIGGFDAAVSGARPVELLPTPCVVDRLASGEMTLDEWDESRRSQKERRVGSFGPRGDSLGAAVLRVEGGSVNQRPDYSSTRAHANGVLLPTPRTTDANGAGRHGTGGPDLRTAITERAWGKYAPAIERWERVVGPAPAPTEPNSNGKPRLNPAFSEWMMGWPAGWVIDPAIGISRNDQLKIVGNGVCPQQAVAALRWLLSVSGVGA